jgi:hypothetical protein
MIGGVFLFKSWGAGYHALHLAGLHKDLEILELIQTGRQSQLLVKGTEAAFQELSKQLSFAEVDRFTLIPDWDSRVERAFYSLEHAEPQGAFLFVEDASLGSLLLWAHEALKSGAAIVDLKIPRGSVQWGILILTAKEFSEGFLSQVRAAGLLSTRVAQPSPALKKYFDIEA